MIRTRRARIVATLGPASREAAQVAALARAGADVFRVNFRLYWTPSPRTSIATGAPSRTASGTAALSRSSVSTITGPWRRTARGA